MMTEKSPLTEMFDSESAAEPVPGSTGLAVKAFVLKLPPHWLNDPMLRN